MKIIIVILLMVSSAKAGWFTNADKERRIEVEGQKTVLAEQLERQQQVTQHWQTATCILGIACPVLLVIGVALGTRNKRDEK